MSKITHVVICRPEVFKRIQQAMADSEFADTVEVVASDFCPEDQLILINKGALELATAMTEQDQVAALLAWAERYSA